MPSFRSPSSQAAHIMKSLQGKENHLPSVGTVRNYEQSLTRVADYLKTELRGNITLKTLTPDIAISYLEHRSQEVGQKTLDMDRQAIQAMFQHITQQLNPGERLPVIKSEHDQILTGRAYTPEQVGLIKAAQTDKNALATELAYSAGLRAHELLTLQPIAEQRPDPRPSLDSKFNGREGQRYTVKGKGGLVREVLIPHPLAERLEARRLPEPIKVTDRGVHYQQHYQLGGGKNWSNSYSAAANRALGWSSGAHGLRHSYAQERMDELQKHHLSREEALRTTSQEMGHFRPEITETYLR